MGGDSQQDSVSQRERRLQKARKMAMGFKDTMQNEPAMRPALYPYLSQDMQNAEYTSLLVSMLDTEKSRSQLEDVLIEQMDEMSPEQLAMWDAMDEPSFDKEAFCTSSSDPELAEAFQKPSILRAILDLSADPSWENTSKHYADAETRKVLQKVMRLRMMSNEAGKPP